MGQYYKAYINTGKEEKIIDSWTYGSGSKLMEHSYLRNDFVGAVYTEINDGSAQVAWIGDYSEGDLPEYVFLKAWGEDGLIPEKEVETSIPEIFDRTTGFLINHTKKQYVNLDAYYCSRQPDDWIYDPLPLLTAIGNGNGGGDYDGDSDLIGAWALDIIEYQKALATDTLPSENPTREYKELTPYF